MPKQDYYRQGQLTDVAYLVLTSLTTPCHGYLIMSKIEEMTGGNVRIGPASLYTTLKKLTEAKFIRLLTEDDAKKVYCITENGLSALRVEIDKRERYAKYGKQAINECYEEGNYVKR